MCTPEEELPKVQHAVDGPENRLVSMYAYLLCIFTKGAEYRQNRMGEAPIRKPPRRPRQQCLFRRSAVRLTFTLLLEDEPLTPALFYN